MSNELEFRVWDKKSKNFVKGKYLYFISNLDGIYKFDCNQDIRFGGIPDQYPLDYVFQLYTGLKDVKGTKIYDGDIVKCRQVWLASIHETPLYSFESVVFDGPGFRLSGRNTTFEGCEVVGNIFQNSEFLK